MEIDIKLLGHNQININKQCGSIDLRPKANFNLNLVVVLFGIIKVFKDWGVADLSA